MLVPPSAPVVRTQASAAGSFDMNSVVVLSDKQQLWMWIESDGV